MLMLTGLVVFGCSRTNSPGGQVDPDPDASAEDAGEAPEDAGPAEDAGEAPEDAGPDVASQTCSGRTFCDCTGGCEPLVDLSTGCLCDCEEPFNCDGIDCVCICGGATYLGCAPAGECEEPRPECQSGQATLVDGCPVCSETDA
jgi:hypothetical protein